MGERLINQGDDMKLFISTVAAFLIGSSAFAAAPDCSKYNLQFSYNSVDAIKDIAAGKITASTRMYSDRCEKAGQTLEVVYSGDPSDPVTRKRPAQARISVTKVTTNVAWTALTDAMAKAQGLANANELRAFLTGIYAKDKNGQPAKDDKGNVIDVTKQPWTYIEFKLVK
jgi:uncharacterized protein YqfB (UPF0267 family)